MIAVDTNILVYSHREDSQFFSPASVAVKSLAEGGALWAIPWPVIHEFLAIVTHPRIYSPPTPISDALVQVDCWLECPTLSLLSEPTPVCMSYLRHVLESARACGARVHDARVAAICLSHGVQLLWSADRDYSRFPGLSVHNPLI